MNNDTIENKVNKFHANDKHETELFKKFNQPMNDLFAWKFTHFIGYPLINQGKFVFTYPGVFYLAPLPNEIEVLQEIAINENETNQLLDIVLVDRMKQDDCMSTIIIYKVKSK